MNRIGTSRVLDNCSLTVWLNHMIKHSHSQSDFFLIPHLRCKCILGSLHLLHLLRHAKTAHGVLDRLSVRDLSKKDERRSQWVSMNQITITLFWFCCTRQQYTSWGITYWISCLRKAVLNEALALPWRNMFVGIAHLVMILGEQSCVWQLPS